MSPSSNRTNEMLQCLSEAIRAVSEDNGPDYRKSAELLEDLREMIQPMTLPRFRPLQK